MSLENRINQNITQYLNYYITTDNPQYAVLINGKWGCGKTFFIKNLMEHWCKGINEVNEYIKLKPIYVSVNGLSNTNQVSKKIKEALNPLLYSKGAQVLRKVFFGVLKTAAHINLDIDGDGESDGKVSFNVDSIGLLKNYDPKIKGQKIIIFDDFERCKIPISELFGYINEYVEHYKCKVIILSDEQKIYDASSEESEQATYKNFKEKLIGQTFTLEVELDKALNHFLVEAKNETVKESQELIKQIFNASEIQNLRTIKQALSDFDRFVPQIDNMLSSHPKYKLFLNNLLGHFLLVYLEFKSGNKEIGNLGNYSLTGDEKEFETKIKSKYGLILDKNNVYHRMSVISYKLILDFLNNGYCDNNELNDNVKKNGFFRDEEEEDWAKLWYWERLEDAEFDNVYENVNKDFKNGKFDNPYKLLHVVTIFFSLNDNGIISKSKKELIKSFKKQITIIFKDNKNDVFSLINDHSWGKSYHDRDSAEFNKLQSYFNEKVKRHNGFNKDDYLKKLFENINDESINELPDKLDVPLPDRSSNYHFVPILITVDGEVLGKKLLTLKSKNLSLFFSFIRRRYYPEEIYSNGQLELFNVEDKECFTVVKDHFQQELDGLERIKKHNVNKHIQFLEDLIIKLEELK
jgi:hypothetical protein